MYACIQTCTSPEFIEDGFCLSNLSLGYGLKVKEWLRESQDSIKRKRNKRKVRLSKPTLYNLTETTSQHKEQERRMPCLQSTGICSFKGKNSSERKEEE